MRRVGLARGLRSPRSPPAPSTTSSPVSLAPSSNACWAADPDQNAAVRLAELLADQGHIDDALQLLRTHAASYRPADMWLIELLAQQGQIDELRDEVTAGTPGAAEALRSLLHGQP